MADIYGVLPSDVAAELPGLYPDGFSTTSSVVATAPTSAQVAAFISIADTMLVLDLERITGAVPAVTDTAAVLVKRAIVDWAIMQVLRVAYNGQDPAVVVSAVQPYLDAYNQLFAFLTVSGGQDTGTGVVPIAPLGSFPAITSFRIVDSNADEYGRQIHYGEPLGTQRLFPF